MRKRFSFSNLNKAVLLVLDWVRINQLVSGSLIIFIGTAVANFGNYLYHLLMGRMLGPVNYGILSSLISLNYFLGVPIGSLNLLIVREVASLKSDRAKLTSFYWWIFDKAAKGMIIGGGLVFFLSFFLAVWLKIESPFWVMVVLFAGLIGFLATVNLSFLQALFEFIRLGGLNILNTFLKLFLAVFLVYLGWGVLGAILPLLLTAILILFFSFLLVRQFLAGERIEFKERGVWQYLGPVFLFNLAHTSLYSSDVVLARRFLSPEEAGFYAALSMLGKIIFFAVSPVVRVMFPLVSERHANGKSYRRIFFLSIILILTITFFISGVYLFFPRLVVSLLFGKNYLPIIPYLKFFIPIFLFFTLSFVFLNYFLSVKKTKLVGIYLLAAVSQFVLILFFHKNLLEIALVFLIVVSFLFVFLLFYYLFNEKK